MRQTWDGARTARTQCPQRRPTRELLFATYILGVGLLGVGLLGVGLLGVGLLGVGLLGVGLLGVPVLARSAAYAVAEAFHWREGLSKTFRQAPGFYDVIGTATIVSILLNPLGINSILALVYSAVINGVVAVPLMVLILLVANKRSIMGARTNGRLSNDVGILTTMAMAAAGALAVLFFRQ